jgi:hypothetical protein
MNIFVLDEDPHAIARHYCDLHLRKMMIEYVQMMCTAYRMSVGNKHIIEGRKNGVWLLPGETYAFDDNNKLITSSNLYLNTHENHPCNKWVRESASNFEWLNGLVWSMGHEYFNRFGKRHTSCIIREKLRGMRNPHNYLPCIGLTPWQQVMPDEYKSENTVSAYRRYYAAKLKDFKKRGLL